jgi:hypothetical protein
METPLDLAASGAGANESNCQHNEESTSSRVKAANVTSSVPVSVSESSVVGSSNSSSSESGSVVVPKALLPRSIALLSQPSDAIVLSPLHALIRKQIEVFSATQTDMSQPSPGRKVAIKLHQVGLRCIHCRDLPLRFRVKRAVCYPTSVGRVYHSVSDMKFDHFSVCKGLPLELRHVLEQLKTKCEVKKAPKKLKVVACSSSTAQYYHDTARQMGMIDHEGSVFMSQHVAQAPTSLDLATQSNVPEGPQQICPKALQPALSSELERARGILLAKLQWEAARHISGLLQQRNQEQTDLMLQQQSLCWQNPISLYQGSDPRRQSPTLFLSCPGPSQTAPLLESCELARVTQLSVQVSNSPIESNEVNHQRRNVGRKKRPPQNESEAERFVPAVTPTVPSHEPVLLSLPSDADYLNDLHCFVRQHVEFFAATKDDAAAPAPGRKTRVMMNQVGIRCVHCAKLPLKDRVKRAVCYPPTLSAIYHSVSNMKFDHFSNCKGLPPAEQVRFAVLRTSCRRRGIVGAREGKARDVSYSNSTAQYYCDTATRMGLVDTDDGGIRFSDPPVSLSDARFSPDAEANGPLMPPENHTAFSCASEATTADGISALMMMAAVTDGKQGGASRKRPRLVSS